MALERRSFVTLGCASLIAPAGARKSFAAVAFDAFAIFDPRPIFQSCEAAFPGRGSQLANEWRVRQFEYQWLRALTGMYVNFWDVTANALEFAARSMNLNLSSAQRDELMHGYLTLRAYPDVAPALTALRRSGTRLAILSNATDRILNAGLENSGLLGMFQHVISTDRIRSFKPDPRAYRLGSQILGLGTRDILFVAFAGWDVAGAGWFGYPTFWNNRQSAVAEELNVRADATGATLAQLVSFMQGSERL